MGNMEQTAFGAWLKAIINKTGLKQIAVADQANIDAVSLSRILNGDRGVSIKTARVLAEAVNGLTGSIQADPETAVRLAVGIEPPEPSPEFDVVKLAQVKLGVNDLTPDEVSEISSELEMAFEVIVNRKKKNRVIKQ